MPDFWSAARRHLRDGETLRHERRLDNADHLFGLAAECAVKYALINQGVAAPPPRGIDNRYTTHIDKLRQDAQVYLSGRGVASLAALLDDSNYFSTWRIEHRYKADGFVDERRCERHAEQARQTLELVQRLLGTGPAP